MKKKEQVKRARAKAQAQAGRSKVDGAAGNGSRDAHSKGPSVQAASSRKRQGPGTDAFKREQSVKTAKWNRFMLIRYLDAGLFFIGLYWALMLLAFQPGIAMVVPVLEIVIALAVMVEVFTTLSSETEYLVWSHRVLVTSCALSAVTLAATVLVGEQLFFPFLSSKMVGAMFCVALIAVKLIIIHRIVLVRDRRDKRYALYQKVLKYNS